MLNISMFLNGLIKVLSNIRGGEITPPVYSNNLEISSLNIQTLENRSTD